MFSKGGQTLIIIKTLLEIFNKFSACKQGMKSAHQCQFFWVTQVNKMSIMKYNCLKMRLHCSFAVIIIFEKKCIIFTKKCIIYNCCLFWPENRCCIPCLINCENLLFIFFSCFCSFLPLLKNS